MNEMVAYRTEQGDVKLDMQTVRNYFVPQGTQASDREIMLFMNICKSVGANPWVRDAHFVKYGNQAASIVMGKDFFIKRAMKNEAYAGMEAGITVQNPETGAMTRREGSLLLSGEKLIGGWAKVHVKGYAVPFFEEVALHEYIGKKTDGTPTAMWLTKPATMIRKVAIVHALREAFPQDFGGIYSQEEINTIDPSTLPTEPLAMPNAIPCDYTVVQGDDEPITPSLPDNHVNHYGAYKGQTVAQVNNSIEAGHFVIPARFKKHAGKTLAELARTDIGYIEWLSKVDDEQVANACKLYLNDNKNRTHDTVKSASSVVQSNQDSSTVESIDASEYKFPSDNDQPLPWDD